MAVCGVICEYNPFQRGHEKQLRQIRAALGENTCVVCLMSGNFVQRGEPAIFEKRVRAQTAVLSGANLVMELPVTKALSSAEGFARGGVEIFSKLGCVDTLAFGCECGNAGALLQAAEAMCEPRYEAALHESMQTGLSYPAARQQALWRMQLDAGILEKPNDILGLEYCKAILQMGSGLKPLALLREGDYHAKQADAENPSATSLRAKLLNGEAIEDFAPPQAQEAYRNARQYDLFSGERAMLAGLRCLPDAAWEKTAHGSEGLWSKARKAAREKGSLEDVIAAIKSKRYPRTRIQRLLLCAFLGLRQENLTEPVAYVRALAFDETGKALLRRMREEGEIPIVNAGQTPQKAALYDLELRAGRLYPLFCREEIVPDGNAERDCRIFLRRDLQ